MAHLTQTQLEFFAVNGYLVVEDVLDEADLTSVASVYDDLKIEDLKAITSLLGHGISWTD